MRQGPRKAVASVVAALFIIAALPTIASAASPVVTNPFNAPACARQPVPQGETTPSRTSCVFPLEPFNGVVGDFLIQTVKRTVITPTGRQVSKTFIKRLPVINGYVAIVGFLEGATRNLVIDKSSVSGQVVDTTRSPIIPTLHVVHTTPGHIVISGEQPVYGSQTSHPRLQQDYATFPATPPIEASSFSVEGKNEAYTFSLTPGKDFPLGQWARFYVLIPLNVSGPVGPELEPVAIYVYQARSTTRPVVYIHGIGPGLTNIFPPQLRCAPGINSGAYCPNNPNGVVASPIPPPPLPASARPEGQPGAAVGGPVAATVEPAVAPFVSPAPASAPTAVSVNSTRPAATMSTPTVGVPITADTGTWTNSPTSFVYEWIECQPPPAPGSAGSTVCLSLNDTGATYTPRSLDVGWQLEVAVIATNAVGNSLASAYAIDGVIGG
jgi:hypothetical protein